MKQIIIFGGVPLLGMLAIWLISVILEKVQSMRVVLLRQALTMLGDALVATVREVQQTIVDAAKQLNEDGELSAQDIAEIKKLSLDVIKRNLGKRGLDLISKVFGLAMGEQMDAFLAGRVEATVHEVIKDPL